MTPIEKLNKKRALYESFKVVIPARYESARFPGKVLTAINNKPMIQHVYERAHESNAAEVIIATDHPEVEMRARDFGADVERTDRSHSSGTDRIREVIENRCWNDETFVVNVQGDSPLITPRSINQVADMLLMYDVDVATLATRITDQEEFYNRHVVKVVWDGCGNALYFSRCPIPSQNEDRVWAWRHLGIYGYTVSAIRQITNAGISQLEKFEQLEQLRALALGLTIKVGIADDPHGTDVDVPADVETVESIMLDGASDR